jgi:putative sterol carrier protein
MADLTSKSFFDTELPTKLTNNPKIVTDLNSILEFQIGGPAGGTWTVDASPEGAGKITEGSTGNAKCVVICGDADFVNILTKKSNAQMAFMSGKLKVKGDMSLALKLQKIFA